MKREYRLRRWADFRKAFKEGKRFLSPRFVLYMNKNALSAPRIGISISKHHFRLATRRNRLRRVARESLTKEINPQLKGYDFVIASRTSFTRPNIEEAVKELKDLISRLNG